MGKMNEAVGEKNPLDKYGGRKRIVRHLTKNDFLKCIGCIILTVGSNLWYEWTPYLEEN